VKGADHNDPIWAMEFGYARRIGDFLGEVLKKDRS